MSLALLFLALSRAFSRFRDIVRVSSLSLSRLETSPSTTLQSYFHILIRARAHAISMKKFVASFLPKYITRGNSYPPALYSFKTRRAYLPRSREKTCNFPVGLRPRILSHVNRTGRITEGYGLKSIRKKKKKKDSIARKHSRSTFPPKKAAWSIHRIRNLVS